MRNPLRKRWGIQVVGTLSGNTREVAFMRCWRRSSAIGWALRMNAVDNGLTRWEVVEL